MIIRVFVLKCIKIVQDAEAEASQIPHLGIPPRNSESEQLSHKAGKFTVQPMKQKAEEAILSTYPNYGATMLPRIRAEELLPGPSGSFAESGRC